MWKNLWLIIVYYGNDRRQGRNKLCQLLPLSGGSLFISPARSKKFKCYNDLKIDIEKEVTVSYFMGISGACLEMKTCTITPLCEQASIQEDQTWSCAYFLLEKQTRVTDQLAFWPIYPRGGASCWTSYYIGGNVGPKAGLNSGVAEKKPFPAANGTSVVRSISTPFTAWAIPRQD